MTRLGTRSNCYGTVLILSSVSSHIIMVVLNYIEEPARIGLIDDDLSVRRAIARLLQTHGYSCVAYGSAEIALADPTLLGMNCIIIDIQLGGINGLEFSERLDALRAGIPRVFITAHTESDLGYLASERLRNSLLLTKPFEEDQLIASIKGAMGITRVGE